MRTGWLAVPLALVLARRASRTAFFRGFDSGLRRHDDGNNKAEVTTPKVDCR